MQIKIAICDDEVKVCTYIEKQLMNICMQKNMEYEIDIFYSGETLCKQLEKTMYDLIFLDIELPKMNGVETGKYIREVKNNNVTQIAYISAKQEYAMELFRVRPVDFLIKPLKEKDLSSVIDVYNKLNNEQDQLFYYKKGYSDCKIELYNIMYFVRSNRRVTVFTVDGEDTFYESLESVYNQIQDKGFLFIHKSYIVNFRFIQKIQYDQVIMKDNTTFSISQARRKDIRDMYRRLETI